MILAIIGENTHTVIEKVSHVSCGGNEAVFGFAGVEDTVTIEAQVAHVFTDQGVEISSWKA
jgi:hypothetical protein